MDERRDGIKVSITMVMLKRDLEIARPLAVKQARPNRKKQQRSTHCRLLYVIVCYCMVGIPDCAGLYYAVLV